MNSKVQALVKETLEWEDWERLLKETELFAKRQIQRRVWRGRKGGVIPEGQDANSIAAGAAIKLLSGKGRLALGWTRERLQNELNRLASNEIRRLYALKETELMRNEWDLLRPTPEGKLRSIFEGIQATGGGGELVDKTQQAAHERDRQKLDSKLGKDEPAKGVLNCLYSGVRKRRHIAAKLGIDVKAVTAARKRLERKAKEEQIVLKE
jgi:hypothetical protein